jgi:predicted nucleotidyltransferase
MDRMNRNELIERLKAYEAPLRESGATGLFIFGSRARDAHHADSDVDLFIDYDPKTRVPNLFRLMQLEDEISEAIGLPVTITTRKALHPLMRDRIERDAIRVV